MAMKEVMHTPIYNNGAVFLREYRGFGIFIWPETGYFVAEGSSFYDSPGSATRQSMKAIKKLVDMIIDEMGYNVPEEPEMVEA
jgi:hypothetical protein